jgi:hypothetical protein
VWALLALSLLLLPRIFLVPAQGSGIRVEDAVLLGLFPATLALMARREVGMGRALRAGAMYFGCVALSAIVAGLMGRSGMLVGLAFGIRPVFYASGFYIGYQLGLRDRSDQRGMAWVASVALVCHVIYGVAARYGIVPNVASFDPSRLSGLTNGPYDLSAMVCLTVVLLLWMRRRLLVAVAVVALLLTKARIAAAAFLLHLFMLTARLRSVQSWLLLATAVVVAVAAIEARNQDGGLVQTLDVVAEVREEFSDVVDSRDEYLEIANSEDADTMLISTFQNEQEGDPSALLRVVRWSIAVATVLKSPVTIAIGMGPGYFSVALDGNYVRVFAETGSVGLVMFMIFMLSIRRSYSDAWARTLALAFILQLMIIALFIDIFFSLKTMTLFWMFLGGLKREEQYPESKDAAAR